MRINELKEYRGSLEPPEDFNEFWNINIEKAECLPLSYTIKKEKESYRNIVLENLYFKGLGNATIHCKIIRPDNRVTLVTE